MSKTVEALATDAFVNALRGRLDRETAERRVVMAEVEQRGTQWAAREIWELRQRLARAERALAPFSVD